MFLDEDAHKKLQHAVSQRGSATCLLTEAMLRKFDIMTGAIVLRQFACANCNHPWWANVPRTKPVSTCKICHVRYDALERDKEFGIGRFMCLDCDHAFYARCEATEFHVCYRCHKLAGPPYINPRFKGRKGYTYEKGVGAPPETFKILNASTPHESTGSTIESFVTEDLGPDIVVWLMKRDYEVAAKDFRHSIEEKPSEVAPHQYEVALSPRDVKDPHLLEVFLKSIPDPKLVESELESDAGQDVSELESDAGQDDTVVSELESDAGQDETVVSELESDAGSVIASRKRTTASDSSDSNSSQTDDDSSHSDSDSSQSDDDSTHPNDGSSQSSDDNHSEGNKVSNFGQCSEPDSGFGTVSNPGTSSELGTASSSLSE